MSRYIDADSLQKILQEHRDFYSPPTSDVEEVKHGRWDWDFSARTPLAICSVCGLSNHQSLSRYCPNCGARMDGGEQ